MNRTIPLALLFAIAIAACGNSHNAVGTDSGVDTTTPVASLDGWSSLITTIGASEAEAATLEHWVETFRRGLNSARGQSTVDAQLAAEAGWWSQARMSLVSVVGEANVDTVIDWLVARFGRRAGT